MKNFLRFGQWPTLGSVAALLLLAAEPVAAQCPIAASCTPGRASLPTAVTTAVGAGILNVSLGTINNTTIGQADGYKDYSCTQNAALLVGQAYTLSVRTPSTTNSTTENVVAWIDYNNSGSFTADEQIMSSVNVLGLRTATFTPPATATLGTRLRLRVSADAFSAPLPTACSTPQYSQVEDYSVTLSANTNPPVAAFTTSGTTTCTGCVQFTDASQNLPTSWLWTFGDGTTSTQQNPSHCYTTPGTYTVTLTARNANSLPTATPATATITYNASVPVAASCSPTTSAYCCNYGVIRFQLNTIDNTSANGSVGYQDFTCPQRTTLTVGVNYPYTVTTGGTQPHTMRIYVDLSNDGRFTANEIITENLNAVSPTGSFMLPSTANTNIPLRLRIVTDAVGNSLDACANPVSGQVEDYTVIAQPNMAAPTPDFTSNYVAGTCQNTIQFTDRSTNLPTSWSWDFGDSTPFSTLQNPSHTYTATGTYTVTLRATNANGNNLVTKTNYVTVQVPCFTYCSSNGTSMQGGGGSSLYINSVALSAVPAGSAFSNVNNLNSAGGYGNYLAQTATLQATTTHTITVVSNLNFSHRTSVWIDYNRDGTFATQEMVANGLTAGGPAAATYTANFTVPATAAGVSTTGTTRMRVVAALNNNAPQPCATNINNAEVEDYTVNILAGPTATRAALALPALAIYPNPTPDGRLHLLLADAGAAGTYAVTVENLLGASLLQASLRLAPAAAAELDLTTLAKGVYVLRLRDAQGRTALHRVVRD